MACPRCMEASGLCSDCEAYLYVRPTVPEEYPGLTKEETTQHQQLEVEASMFGLHSLSEEKYTRYMELSDKVFKHQQLHGTVQE